MQATLSSLPDEVIDSVGEKAAPGEEALMERRRKLEFLQQEEELIKVATFTMFQESRLWPIMNCIL